MVVVLALNGETVVAQSVDVGEGVSWALAEHRAETMSDIRYAYHLSVPDALNVPLRGTLHARFVWSDPRGGDVVFDFKDPDGRVSAVRVNDVPVQWVASHDHVVLPAQALIQAEHNSVEIEFSAGDEALNRNEDFLYTLFVPDRAHFSLPLFDQPNLKARFTLTLEIPQRWVAVANGETVGESRSAGAKTTYRFAETEVIPTYLFAFAVGAFEVEVAERAGRTLRMFHRETDVAKLRRNREAIFDLHAVALDWLEDYTQIPYPFGKFDFVLIPPFQYGGMEHPGSIFYRESSLLLDESATQAQYLGRASLIAHETAHMWFGDLVTMDWFDDVWMKEVFANFMAAKIVHPSFPEVNHELRFLLAHHDVAYQVDRTAGANPIRQRLENLNDAGTLYGPIIYQKAPVVMRQLEGLVGEVAFRDGLREYLDAYRYGNASWPDLIDILDRQTSENLENWSAVWIDEPGRPTVEARLELDANGQVSGATVFQDDPADLGRVWPQELELLLRYDDRDRRLPVSLAASSVSVEGLEASIPIAVLPNAAGLEYGHFRLDMRTRETLLATLPEIADPLTRGIVWVTLWDGVLHGEVAVNEWFELLLRGLASEVVEQNTQRLLAYLETTFWRFLSADERIVVAADLERALWRGLTENATPTGRSAFFRAWRQVVLTEPGIGRLRRIWAEEEAVPGVILSEQDFTAIAETLAILDGPNGSTVLARQAERIENRDRLARFNFIRPALSADPATREVFFDALRDPAAREREPWVLSALRFLHHPLRSEHARQFIAPSLALLAEIRRTGDIFFPSGWLDATLDGHSSAEAADIVRRFLDARGPSYPQRLRAKVLQSADLLFRAARVAEQSGP